MSDDESGWVGFAPGGDNSHLPPGPREQADQLSRQTDARRGPEVARVVVTIYDNGEAVPFVSFMHDPGSMVDAARRAVVLAQTALADWS